MLVARNLMPPKQKSYEIAMGVSIHLVFLQLTFTAIAVSLPLPSGVFFPVFVVGESTLSLTLSS